MKFSHSLQFNAVPDWSNHYIAYSNLKKLIYTLETRLNQNTTAVDAESSPLLSGASDDPDKVFIRALDVELEKICSFYNLKESEVYGEANDILRDEESYEDEQEEYEHEREMLPPGKKGRSGSIFKAIGFGRARVGSTASKTSTITEEDEDSDDGAQETSLLRRRSEDGNRQRRVSSDHHDNASSRRRTSQAFDDYSDMSFSALYDKGVSLKQRTVSIYVSLCELRSFLQLNKTGFEKVLKKYDKIMDRKLKRSYLEEHVYLAEPFQKGTMNKLTQHLSRIETIYSRICTKGDVEEAKRELRLHLREHVVWERNTVWREMIGIERKAQSANIGLSQLLGRDSDPNQVRRQGDEVNAALTEVKTPIGKYRCPAWLLSTQFWTGVFILAIFVVLLVVPIMEKPEQQNCLAMVIFVSLLWATEVRISTWTLMATNFDRRSLSSLRLSLCPSWPSLFASSATIPQAGDLRLSLQLLMSSLPCGRPSSCFFSAASPSQQLCRSTTLPRSWPPLCSVKLVPSLALC